MPKLALPASSRRSSSTLGFARSMKTIVAHKDNAPGDFYVEDGCCVTCAVPFTVAPDMFAWATEDQCVVCKQPETAEELNRMVAAFKVADMGCIRYKGNERSIQIRLVKSGDGNQCDQLPPDLAAKLNSSAPRFGQTFTSDVRITWSVLVGVFSAIKRWLGGNA